MIKRLRGFADHHAAQYATLLRPTRAFEDITEDDVKKVMHRLNHRPRKTLNYKTPFEVFFEDSLRKAA